jgi:hypothetical protein
LAGGAALGALLGAAARAAGRIDRDLVVSSGAAVGAELSQGFRVEQVGEPFAGGIDVVCVRAEERVRLQVRALGGRHAPVAATEHAGIYVMNGGRGDAPTADAHRALAEALAERLRRTERRGTLAALRPKES